jgi:hypothetical protein
MPIGVVPSVSVVCPASRLMWLVVRRAMRPGAGRTAGRRDDAPLGRQFRLVGARDDGHLARWHVAERAQRVRPEVEVVGERDVQIASSREMVGAV